MSDSWPPPQGQPEWPPPQASVPPAQPFVPPAQPFVPPEWPPPSAAASAWPPPQQPAAPGAWPPPQNGAPPTYWAPPRTTDDAVVEWLVPINRSGLAVAAGYVALLSFPVLFAAPVGVLLGFLALNDLKRNPHRRGRGRAWFAIVYGGLGTVALLLVLYMRLAVAVD